METLIHNKDNNVIDNQTNHKRMNIFQRTKEHKNDT